MLEKFPCAMLLADAAGPLDLYLIDASAVFKKNQILSVELNVPHYFSLFVQVLRNKHNRNILVVYDLGE